MTVDLIYNCIRMFIIWQMYVLYVPFASNVPSVHNVSHLFISGWPLECLDGLAQM